MVDKNSFVKTLYKKIELKYLILIVLLIIISSVFIINLIPNSNITGLVVNNDFVYTKMINGCISFEESILWSSGFTNKKNGITNYQTWYPKNNCSELGIENCYITNIRLNSRIISTNIPEGETESIGYIQISNLINCENPEKGDYSEYLTYDKTFGEEIKKGDYCRDKLCNDIKEDDVSTSFKYNFCYGIKAYSSQYMILDSVSIKYDLCYDKEGYNEK